MNSSNKFVQCSHTFDMKEGVELPRMAPFDSSFLRSLNTFGIVCATTSPPSSCLEVKFVCSFPRSTLATSTALEFKTSTK